MKNILVPIGTSENSYLTLQYAIEFGKEFSAQVYAMEVFAVSATAGSLANVAEKVSENSMGRLKEIIGKVDTHGSEIKIATYNGELINGIHDLDKEIGIDLVVIAPKSSSIKEELYLGPISGKIIKQTDIPTLIVPKGTAFKPFKKILMAFKSGILKRNRILDPLVTIKNRFRAQVNMLLVKTPGYADADLVVNPALMDLSQKLTITEKGSTYLGVLEHFQSHNPDLLCVFRRKRGFFKKLWEKSTILKSEFFVDIPVLVLSVKKD